MMKNDKKYLLFSAAFLLAFVVWTFLLFIVDVDAIGPNGSCVGFSKINEACHKFFGENFSLYYITDWLGLVPVAFVFVFAFLGLFQVLKRKSFFKVDSSLLITGAFYIAVLAVFLFFESFVVNYRPVLINGVLEASYPSSTTLLTCTVIPSAVILLRARIKNRAMRLLISVSLFSFLLFMVAARLVSGVHWLSDIIGGIFISAGLVLIYTFFIIKYPDRVKQSG